MEVATFLRATLRRWWIVLLVVLIAAGVTFLVMRNTKDSYDGSVVLTVPAAQAATTGSNGQYVENFQTALTTTDVVKQVAADTGESTDALTAGLGASQLQNSSFISITYNAATSTRAKAVVVSAAKRTAAYLSRSATRAAAAQKAAALASVATAQQKLTTAQKAMTAFTAKYGFVDPTVALQSAQSSVTQLSVSRLQAIANNRSTKGFDDAIAAARKQVATLGPIVRQFNSASDQLHQAQVAYSDAQSKQAAATQSLATAEAAPLLDDATADLVKGSTVIVKAVAIAAGVGLVLGLALAMLLAAIRRDKPHRRRRRKSAAAADTAAEDAEPTVTPGADGAAPAGRQGRDLPRDEDLERSSAGR